jgi:hypothetical protein
MPALVAGIHVFATVEDVDGRDKPGHDEVGVISGARSAGRGSIHTLTAMDSLPLR